MKPYKWILCLWLVMGIAALSGCQSQQGKTLKVGTSLEYPPFEYTDKNQQLTGIDIELIKAYAKSVNREVTFVPMAFVEIIPALKAGKIDVAISAMTITEQRIREVEFSDPYMKTYPVLLIDAASPVKSGADLNKQSVKIGVTNGTTGQLLAKNLYANAEIVSFDAENDVVTALQNRQLDVIITDLIPALKVYEQDPTKLRINPAPLSDDFEYWGIAVQKNNLELRDQINQFLQNYRESGKMKKLVDPYLKDIKSKLDEYDIPLYY